MNIDTEETARDALKTALDARKKIKEIEETRKNLVKPFYEMQQSFNKIAKQERYPFEEIEISCIEEIRKWLTKQQENPFTQVDRLECPEGSIYLKETWTYDIECFEDIDMEYLKPNQDLIEEAIQKGIRDIPGVRIYKKTSTQMRLKNQGE